MTPPKKPDERQSLKDRGVGSLPAKKRAIKSGKLIEFGQFKLLETRAGFEDYVRIYRLVHDCDPDTEEVSNHFPFEDYIVE